MWANNKVSKMKLNFRWRKKKTCVLLKGPVLKGFSIFYFDIFFLQQIQVTSQMEIGGWGL